MRSLFKNKKGDASDYITFIIVVFFLAVTFLIATFSNDKISDVIQDTELNSTDVATSSISQIDTWTTSTTQKMFGAIVLFLIMGMMVSSFLVKVHPVFIFLYIIFLAIAIFTAIPLSNSYQLIADAGALSSIASQQTTINWIMEHLILITLIASALSMIVLFAKLSSRGGVSSGQL